MLFRSGAADDIAPGGRYLAAEQIEFVPAEGADVESEGAGGEAVIDEVAVVVADFISGGGHGSAPPSESEGDAFALIEEIVGAGGGGAHEIGREVVLEVADEERIGVDRDRGDDGGGGAGGIREGRGAVGVGGGDLIGVGGAGGEAGIQVGGDAGADAGEGGEGDAV